MTFIYKLNVPYDPYLLKMDAHRKKELSTSRLSKVIVLHTYVKYIERPKLYYHAASPVVIVVR